ncbi:MAG: elongation factor P maturation arginine rhamnosyltransferase EarP [Burkholderiaceae bacterium]
MQWDLYCRVVDNFGDLGVCWRLATDLASRGERVRLWVDDASALAWLAPGGAPGVVVRAWPSIGSAPPGIDTPVGDVVVAAFGCTLPDAMLAALAGASPRTVWINLEYLSAETYVERSHGLPSLQSTGAAAGATQWFYYPGYTAATGGLLRESDLAARRQSFDRATWRASVGLLPRDGERLVSLFCYDPQPALPALIEALSDVPTLLLVTPGAATRQARDLLGTGLSRGRVRGVALPWLAQPDYDHLLWASDLNCVRGEDSWVRAQWAGRPFLWQAYPQGDRVHAAKVHAFLDRSLEQAPGALATAVRAWSAAWNGLAPSPAALPDLTAWQLQSQHWRDRLWAEPDLATKLIGFVAARR